MLVGVTDPLALVGLGPTKLADVRGDLAHDLLVDAVDGELRRRLDLEGDAFGRLERHRMAVSETQLDRGRTLGEDAVTDTDDLQLLLEAVGDAGDHVLDQGARQAVQRLVLALLVRTRHLDAVIAHRDRDGLGNRVAERSLGPLDRDVLAVDRDLDTARYSDGQLANA